MVNKLRLEESRNRRLSESLEGSVIIAKRADVDIHVDDYNEGEGEYIQSFNLRLKGEYNSIDSLIKDICDEFGERECNLGNFVFYEEQSAIGTNFLVNDDNWVADEMEIEAWKNGRETLYIADVYVPVQVATKSRDMTYDDVKDMGFGDIV